MKIYLLLSLLFATTELLFAMEDTSSWMEWRNNYEPSVTKQFKAAIKDGINRDLESLVHQKTNDGSSPLHHAAFKGDIETVRSLLAQGASVDQKNNYGVTALHAAVYKNHQRVVLLLLEAGASRYQKTHFGVTPLEMAQEFAGDAIINLLERWPQIFAQRCAIAKRVFSKANDHVLGSLSPANILSPYLINEILQYLPGDSASVNIQLPRATSGHSILGTQCAQISAAAATTLVVVFGVWQLYSH